MSVADRLAEIRALVAAACGRAGRDTAEVRVLAVTKQQSDSAVEEAYAAGLRDFGENYVQELLGRRERLAHLAGATWHLIGHLQSNKAKQALRCADVFHALDSVRLAEVLARQARAAGRARPWPVYLEVNIDAAPTKSGVRPEDAARLAEAVRALPELELRGLMCVPEPGAAVEDARPSFQKLAALARGVGVRELSMGMSGDFGVAVEEGATWIRIGRAMFGERPLLK